MELTTTVFFFLLFRPEKKEEWVNQRKRKPSKSQNSYIFNKYWVLIVLLFFNQIKFTYQVDEAFYVEHKFLFAFDKDSFKRKIHCGYICKVQSIWAYICHGIMYNFHLVIENRGNFIYFKQWHTHTHTTVPYTRIYNTRLGILY